MRIFKVQHAEKTLWSANTDYSEKDIPKVAKWLWHGECRMNCRGCAAGAPKRSWWTDKLRNAAKLVKYGEGEVRNELESYIAATAAALASSRAVDADLDVPAPKGLEYFPFQRGGIAYGIDHPSVLIADEMGLGKTVQALGIINADPSIKTALFIVPSSLRINWLREANRWLTRSFDIQVIVKREPIRPEAQIIIFNYEKLVGKKGEELLNQLTSREWDMMMVDEAHYVKNPKTKRTKAVLGREGRPGIAQVCRRKVFLTGTPILNRPVEIWPLLACIAPKEFGNYWAFVRRYCNASRTQYGWDVSGAANLEELQRRLRETCMVRRLKADVLRDLPAKIREVITVPANGASQQVAFEIAEFEKFKERLRDLRDEVELAHAKGNKDEYKACVGRLRDTAMVAFQHISTIRHDTALAKLPAVITHLKDTLEKQDKVICFAHHKDVIAGIAEEFDGEAVVLTGSSSQQERQDAVDRFQNDPKVKLFIGSIKAAGVGLTLTASSTVIFAELDWTPSWISQCEDRAHRIGQEDCVLVQHLVLDGSLDSRMAKRLVIKQNIADMALDNELEDLPVIPVLDDDAYEDRPAKYPQVEDAVRDGVHTALKTLSALCDGAAAQDGQGFNKIDSKVGKSLAAEERLTDGQVWLARRVLPKYRRQLSAELNTLVA